VVKPGTPRLLIVVVAEDDQGRRGGGRRGGGGFLDRSLCGGCLDWTCSFASSFWVLLKSRRGPGEGAPVAVWLQVIGGSDRVASERR
jgi:hypothetical protein